MIAMARAVAMVEATSAGRTNRSASLPAQDLKGEQGAPQRHTVDRGHSCP